MTTRNKFAAGVVAGALLGAATGILLAPTSGKETRRTVATRLGDLRIKARSRFGSRGHETGNGRHSERAPESSGRDVGVAG
jgi:gas vesicle protein